jgi:hypothetical protein
MFIAFFPSIIPFKAKKTGLNCPAFSRWCLLNPKPSSLSISLRLRSACVQALRAQ